MINHVILSLVMFLKRTDFWSLLVTKKPVLDPHVTFPQDIKAQLSNCQSHKILLWAHICLWIKSYKLCRLQKTVDTTILCSWWPKKKQKKKNRTLVFASYQTPWLRNKIFTKSFVKSKAKLIFSLILANNFLIIIHNLTL